MWGRQRCQNAKGKKKVGVAAKFSNCMENTMSKVIRNCRVGSIASLIKRCQDVFGCRCLRYCPQIQMPSWTICHENPSSVFLSDSLSLLWALHQPKAAWIPSKLEAKLVCKLSLSEIKTQLKPLMGSFEFTG